MKISWDFPFPLCVRGRFLLFLLFDLVLLRKDFSAKFSFCSWLTFSSITDIVLLLFNAIPLTSCIFHDIRRLLL